MPPRGSSCAARPHEQAQLPTRRCMDQTTALGAFLTARGFRRHDLSENRVGHLQLVGQLAGRTIDILVDTGAASTVVDLNYCREQQMPVHDTGSVGGGAGGVHLPIYTLGNVSLSLDGAALRSDGIFAIDLAHVNQGLAMKGAPPTNPCKFMSLTLPGLGCGIGSRPAA